jgi:hypothetical protein
LTDLDPPATEIINIPVKPGSPPNTYVDDIPLAFKVRSEDLQRKLYTVVFVDFPGNDTKLACPLFPADLGTLDTARPRECKLNINASVSPGCRPITAIVSHDPAIYGGVIRDPSDVGTATWWAQIGGTDPWFPCPPHRTTGDAGTDGGADGGLL